MRHREHAQCTAAARGVVILAVTMVIVSCNAAGDNEASSRAPDSVGATTSNTRVLDSASSPGPSAQTEAAQPGPLLITPDGWGPLRIGMTQAQVVAAAGPDADPGAVGGPDPATCDEFRPSNAPAGVLVMMRNGILTRISVSRNRDIASPADLRVGDTGAEALKRHGAQATVANHAYLEPPAKYITVWSPSVAGPARRGIRYEVNSTDEIVFIRGGTDSITLVEGCV
jgi:hypothetical protein